MANIPTAMKINMVENPHQNKNKMSKLDSKVLSDDDKESVNSLSSDSGMNSNSGSYYHNMTPVSNLSGQSPTINMYNTDDETIDIPIFQKEGNTIFILLTFPTQTIIRNIKGITNDFSDSLIEYQVYSPYGITSGNPFNSQTKFLPGDYCIGLAFRNNEEADKITSVKLHINSEPVSNLMLSQIIFGLYRSLGFEPSHVLKYSTKSINSGTPFYRKTRGEINKIVETINKVSDKITSQNDNIDSHIRKLDQTVIDLSSKISDPLADIQSKLKEVTNKLSDESILKQVEDIQSQISQLQEQIDIALEKDTDDIEKGSPEVQSITVSDFEKLINERDSFYNKLVEAEEHIDYLQEEFEKQEQELKNKTVPKPKWTK
jgi:gas vesicle protein